MNLDELVESVPEVELRDELFRWVNNWKSDQSDVDSLSRLIRKWHANVTFSDPTAQDQFFARFEEFRDNAIRNIGGMTVNERLYWFCLFDQWDSSHDGTKERLRAKLRAVA